MPAYGGPRYTIVQLLHRMWPRRSTIAELMPHCATPGEFSVSHHPEGPSPGSLKNITPLTVRFAPMRFVPPRFAWARIAWLRSAAVRFADKRVAWLRFA